MPCSVLSGACTVILVAWVVHLSSPLQVLIGKLEAKKEMGAEEKALIMKVGVIKLLLEL